MKTLAVICAWLELLGLGILMGGMLTIGVLVAPVVFTLLPPMQAGGEVMSAIFSRFNSVLAYICLGLILAGFIGKMFWTSAGKIIRILEAAVITLLLALTLYLGLIVTPEMNALRDARIQQPENQEAVEAFGRRHSLSQTIFGINLLLVLVGLYLNAMQLISNQREAIQ